VSARSAKFQGGPSIEHSAPIRTGIVHVRFGKAPAFHGPKTLLENLKALQETIGRQKPSGAQGR